MENAPMQTPSALIFFEGNNLDRMIKAADMLSRSGLVPDSLKGKPDSVFAVLCYGAEMGLPPMTALTTIHVINGRPTLSAQLMLAMVYKRCPGAQIRFELDQQALKAKCLAARPGQPQEAFYIAEWDMARASLMGLTTRDQYRKQALTMLKWRAVAEAVRAVFPEIVLGLYATEELQDFDGKEMHDVKNLVPTLREINQEALDQMPPEQKEVGNPEYIIGHGTKFRGVALKDADPEELSEYEETLTARSKKGALKPWESEVLTSIRLFLGRLENAVETTVSVAEEILAPPAATTHSTDTIAAPICCGRGMMISKYNPGIWYCPNCKSKQERVA